MSPTPATAAPLTIDTLANALASALVRHGVTANAVSAFGLVTGHACRRDLCGDFVWPSIERPLLVLAAAFRPTASARQSAGWNGGARGGISSPTGPLWNEMPDRAADVSILVGVGYASTGNPTLGWLAAVVAVATAYVRAEARASGRPNDFCGPMAKPHRMPS